MRRDRAGTPQALADALGAAVDVHKITAAGAALSAHLSAAGAPARSRARSS
ncbi:hypothetical protein ACFQ3Z_38145 [Streptomyces nogalater]